MPSRSAWKSALIDLGLFLTIIGFPWVCVSALRPLNGTEYEPVSFQVAVNFLHWGGLSWFFYVIFFVTTLYFAVMGFNKLFYSYFYYPTARIDVSGRSPQLIAAYGPRTNLPKWELADMGGCNFSIAKIHIVIPMSVQPITANPKVRNLAYEVRFDSDIKEATAEHILQLVRHATTAIKQTSSSTGIYFDGALQNALQIWLQFQLFNFNEAASRELAGFFNPLDPEQQKNFRFFVMGYFQSILEGSGLKISDARFSLPA